MVHYHLTNQPSNQPSQQPKTNSTQKNSYWDADSTAAGREMSRLIWNRKLHFRDRKRCHWFLSKVSWIHILLFGFWTL